MARLSGKYLRNGDNQQINIYNLAALRASAKGLMADGRCDDCSGGGLQEVLKSSRPTQADRAFAGGAATPRC